jgi:hypothetical protein
MAYVLDANVFIQAKNLHYGLDFCPAFWDWLIAGNAANQVFSIEKVGDEILAGGDQLADWASDRGPDFSSSLTVSCWLHLVRSVAGRPGKAMNPLRSTRFFKSRITTWLHMPLPTDIRL